MNNELLITIEIFLVVVTPLLFLYLRGNWPLRVTIPCLLSIPIFWYLTYSPLHELSHATATYLVGGKVTYVKLIPKFWLGEFGRAWITQSRITQTWQQLVSTASPYIVDIVSIAVGTIALRRDSFKNAFIVGLALMLLCLRPSFDFVCEPIAFLTGDRGDFFAIQSIIGSSLTWLFIVFSLGFSLLSVVGILKRFVGFPEPLNHKRGDRK